MCGEGDTSGSLAGSFRTLCELGNCEVQVSGASSYYGYAEVYQNGGLLASVSASATVEICNGDSLVVLFHEGAYGSSNTITVTDQGELTLQVSVNNVDWVNVDAAPSAITGTPHGVATSATFAIAEICGTPTPATIRVVQIEPGPIPTLIPSAKSAKTSPAFAVAIFPTTTSQDKVSFMVFAPFTTFIL